MNPKQGRDELLKNIDSDAHLTFNGPRDDDCLGALVDTYVGTQGFTKFLAREREIWNDGNPTSYSIRETHLASCTNTTFLLTEMVGVIGENKEEVLIRFAELWNFSSQGKVKGVLLFATPYYKHSERLPPRMEYLESSVDSRKTSEGAEKRLTVDPELTDSTGPRINHFGMHGGEPA